MCWLHHCFWPHISLPHVSVQMCYNQTKLCIVLYDMLNITCTAVHFSSSPLWCLFPSRSSDASVGNFITCYEKKLIIANIYLIIIQTSLGFCAKNMSHSNLRRTWIKSSKRRLSLWFKYRGLFFSLLWKLEGRYISESILYPLQLWRLMQTCYLSTSMFVSTPW